jgi:No apical meristem-associated C-terminal domain
VGGSNTRIHCFSSSHFFDHQSHSFCRTTSGNATLSKYSINTLKTIQFKDISENDSNTMDKKRKALPLPRRSPRHVERILEQQSKQTARRNIVLSPVKERTTQKKHPVGRQELETLITKDGSEEDSVKNCDLSSSSTETEDPSILKNSKKVNKTVTNTADMNSDTSDSSNCGSSTALLSSNKPSKPVSKKAKSKSFQAKNRIEARKNKMLLSQASAGRGKDFSESEDYYIAKAFVSTSENPIKGADQTSIKFTNEMHKKFCSMVALDQKTFPERKPFHVFTRYQKHIRPSMNIYLKHYKFYKENCRSGWNEDDIIKAASEAYLEETGKAFKFVKCLPVLINHPKFAVIINPTLATAVPGVKKTPKKGNGNKGAVTSATKQKAKNETDTTDNILVCDTNSDVIPIDITIQTNNISSGMGGQLKRPIGVKAAKKAMSKDRNEKTLNVAARKLEALETTAKNGSVVAAYFKKKMLRDDMALQRSYYVDMYNMAKDMGDTSGQQEYYMKLKELNRSPTNYEETSIASAKIDTDVISLSTDYANNYTTDQDTMTKDDGRDKITKATITSDNEQTLECTVERERLNQEENYKEDVAAAINSFIELEQHLNVVQQKAGETQKTLEDNILIREHTVDLSKV